MKFSRPKKASNVVQTNHATEEGGSSTCLTTGINQLPNELLIHIFRFCLSIRRQFTFYQYYPDLLRLQLVCRTWNSVLIACADLWAYMDGSDPYLESHLARSQDALLHVFLYCYWEGPERKRKGLRRKVALTAIAAQAARWRTANILLEKTEFWVLETIEAPHLEKLSLRSTTGETVANLPRDFTHVLRALHLDSISLITWTTPLLLNLHHLSLSQLHAHSPSAEELLQLLKGCSGLKTLRLEDLHVRHQMAVLHAACIPLPQLQSISIKRLSFSSSFLILSALQLPSLTKFETASLTDDPSQPSFTYSHANLVIPAFPTTASVSVRLAAVRSSGYQLQMTGKVASKRVTFSLSLQFPTSVSLIGPILPLLGNFSSSDADAELHLNGLLDMSPLDLVEVLRRLPRVTGLIVDTKKDINPLVQALSYSRNATDERLIELLPRLERLDFTACQKVSATRLLRMVKSRSRGRADQTSAPRDEEPRPVPLMELKLGPGSTMDAANFCSIYANLNTPTFRPITSLIARLDGSWLMTKLRLVAKTTNEKCRFEIFFSQPLSFALKNYLAPLLKDSGDRDTNVEIHLFGQLDASASDAVQILQDLPRITKIALEGNGINHRYLVNTLIHALSSPGTSEEWTLPRLTALRFQQASPGFDEKLLRLVDSRHRARQLQNEGDGPKPPAAFDEISIGAECPMSRDVYAAIREIVGAGVKWDITAADLERGTVRPSSDREQHLTEGPREGQVELGDAMESQGEDQRSAGNSNGARLGLIGSRIQELWKRASFKRLS